MPRSTCRKFLLLRAPLGSMPGPARFSRWLSSVRGAQARLRQRDAEAERLRQRDQALAAQDQAAQIRRARRQAEALRGMPSQPGIEYVESDALAMSADETSLIQALELADRQRRFDACARPRWSPLLGASESASICSTVRRSQASPSRLRSLLPALRLRVQSSPRCRRARRRPRPFRPLLARRVSRRCQARGRRLLACRRCPTSRAAGCPSRPLCGRGPWWAARSGKVRSSLLIPRRSRAVPTSFPASARRRRSMPVRRRRPTPRWARG